MFSKRRQGASRKDQEGDRPDKNDDFSLKIQLNDSVLLMAGAKLYPGATANEDGLATAIAAGVTGDAPLKPTKYSWSHISCNRSGTVGHELSADCC